VRTHGRAGTVKSPHKPADSSAGDRSQRALLRGAEVIAELFKMLGNVNRLKILLYLAAGDRSVNDIETALKIRQPTLSQQLGELRDARLIAGRRVAKSVIYGLTSDRGSRALQAIHAANDDDAAAEQILRQRSDSARRSQPAAVFGAILSPNDEISK